MDDLKVHTYEDFEKFYSGRDWTFYRDLVAGCILYGDPGPILDVGAGLAFGFFPGVFLSATASCIAYKP